MLLDNFWLTVSFELQSEAISQFKMAFEAQRFGARITPPRKKIVLFFLVCGLSQKHAIHNSFCI
jgi:hypothetical protein